MGIREGGAGIPAQWHHRAALKRAAQEAVEAAVRAPLLERIAELEAREVYTASSDNGTAWVEDPDAEGRVTAEAVHGDRIRVQYRTVRPTEVEWCAQFHPYKRARLWFRQHLQDFDECARCGYARINVRHDAGEAPIVFEGPRECEFLVLRVPVQIPAAAPMEDGR